VLTWARWFTGLVLTGVPSAFGSLVCDAPAGAVPHPAPSAPRAPDAHMVNPAAIKRLVQFVVLVRLALREESLESTASARHLSKDIERFLSSQARCGRL
jgi:hypothetical protein